MESLNELVSKLAHGYYEIEPMALEARANLENTAKTEERLFLLASIFDTLVDRKPSDEVAELGRWMSKYINRDNVEVLGDGKQIREVVVIEGMFIEIPKNIEFNYNHCEACGGKAHNCLECVTRRVRGVGELIYAAGCVSYMVRQRGRGGRGEAEREGVRLEGMYLASARELWPLMELSPIQIKKMNLYKEEMEARAEGEYLLQ